MPDVQTCDVCGAEKPADMVERTTVDTIGPMEADVCATCRQVQDHQLPDDVCMKCGDELEAGSYLEIEFPLGAAELPGHIAGYLCGDCAAWIAHRINYSGIDADDEAYEEYLDRIKEEDRRLRAPEESA
jgi:hypothetical protein